MKFKTFLANYSLDESAEDYKKYGFSGFGKGHEKTFQFMLKKAKEEKMTHVEGKIWKNENGVKYEYSFAHHTFRKK